MIRVGPDSLLTSHSDHKILSQWKNPTASKLRIFSHMIAWPAVYIWSLIETHVPLVQLIFNSCGCCCSSFLSWIFVHSCVHINPWTSSWIPEQVRIEEAVPTPRASDRCGNALVRIGSGICSWNSMCSCGCPELKKMHFVYCPMTKVQIPLRVHCRHHVPLRRPI